MTDRIDRPRVAEPLTQTMTVDPPAGAWTAPLRVVVADDHPLYRQGIVRAVEAAGGIVVGEAGDGRDALELIAAARPDVAVVDVSMPSLDGIDVVERLAAHGPDVPVVLLSAFSDEALVRSGLLAGAADYVLKSADRDDILAAIAGAARRENAPRALARSRAGDGRP